MTTFHAIQRTDEQENAAWVHFSGICCEVEAWKPEEVLPALRSLEAHAANGLHAVGWMAYEAAPAFDPHYQVHSPPDTEPLLRFTVYRHQHQGLPKRECPPCKLEELTPLLDAKAFRAAVKEIHGAIACGETYQVNFTYPWQAKLSGSPWSLFRRLRQAQSARHQAYIEESDRIICCASPERFFKHQQNRISCKPMKGTAAPGQESVLQSSEKDRSENIMIVDMIRNDLGKIADAGSVNANPVFEVESFPSVVQMTSTVTATGSSSAVDWMSALFPCASITGAPKQKTMEWIHRLESGPRGVYTGCIGGFYGDGITEFNVAIRTAVIERESGRVRYHSGCGIVWDSDPAAEHQESQLKASVLTHQTQPFQLIETMRGEPGKGIPLWPFHRERLLHSAAALGLELNLAELDQRIAELEVPKLGKVRLTLSEAGKLDLQQSPLPPALAEMTFRIDSEVTPSTHPALRHKTTRREVYTQARERHPDVQETLLRNERGECMEFCIGNLMWIENGQAFTPPLSSGLLPGVARAQLLAAGEVKEKICFPETLLEAEEIYLINALRGRVRMRLV